MKVRLQGWTLFCVILLVGVGAWQIASLIPGSLIPGLQDIFAGTVDPSWERPPEVPNTAHRVYVTINVAEQDSLTTCTGSVYVWYDADKDGTVDVGSGGVGSEGSEVEVVSLSSGAGTTKRTYWTDTEIGIQTHATGCYVNYVERTIPDMGQYTTTVSVDTIYVWDVYTSASATANDQTGASLATATDYNYTLKGTTLTMTLRLTITGNSEGFGQEPYTDWGTGYSYTGPFCVIAVDNIDTDLIFDLSVVQMRESAGKFYYYFMFSPLFNDQDTTADGYFTYTVTISILGAGDFDVYFFDYVRTDYFNACNYGSADATISDIDIVA